jgi:5-methylcytosine-specific restriction endonuclease McrA
MITRDGNRCSTCKAAFNKARYVKQKRPYDLAEWKHISRKLRDEQPWCSRCGSQADLTVDHVIPLSAGGELIPNDPELLRVLCRKCHGAVTSHKTKPAHDCA